jgi:two-component system chemotaxis response regulator CheY
MILIVDDDEDLAETCAMMLEGCGYDVTVALTGEAALHQIDLHSPDLLILDCRMPGMTGVELCARLRARPEGISFPILLMSSSLKKDVASGGDYDSFIKKPFLAENLILEVSKLLKLNRSSPEVKI